MECDAPDLVEDIRLFVMQEFAEAQWRHRAHIVSMFIRELTEDGATRKRSENVGRRVRLPSEIEEFRPFIFRLANDAWYGSPACRNAMDLNDVVQFGVLGAVKALRSRRHDTEAKFSTYLYSKVRFAILDGIRTSAAWEAIDPGYRQRRVTKEMSRYRTRRSQGLCVRCERPSPASNECNACREHRAMVRMSRRQALSGRQP